MQVEWRNYLTIILYIILILGIFRFIYATTFKENVSLFKDSYIEKTIGHSTKDSEYKRSWGPLAIFLFNSIEKYSPKKYSHFNWRIGQYITYGFLILILSKIMSEIKSFFQNNNNYLLNIIIFFICLQSSSAIYNINQGGGEIFTSLCIIGHFYFFYKKKYLIAALFIIAGIYFKFYPVIFAFAYFIFALFSKEHKKYILYLLFIGLIGAIAAYPLKGLIYGSLYPISIIFSVMSQSAGSIPFESQELFNFTSLINKIIYGFKVERSLSNIYQIPYSMKIILIIFIISHIILTILASYKLSKFEYKWKNNNKLRILHLIIFQSLIGFLYLIFSIELSIEHLLNASISIFGPLFIFAATINKFADLNFSKVFFVTSYIIGICFIGWLLPISIMSMILPYNFIDNLINDSTNIIGGYGRFIWYHFPLLGIFILAIVNYFYLKYYFNVE